MRGWALALLGLTSCSTGPAMDAGRPPSVVGHDACDPDLSLAQPGPMKRPLRLAGGELAFVELRHFSCSAEIFAVPSLVSLGTIRLANPPCQARGVVADHDADGTDELYVEVREHYDEADPTRPHDVTASVLELPSFRERWRSETIRTYEYPSADFSTADDDWFSFFIDADGDCALDVLEERDWDSPAPPRRVVLHFAPDLVVRAETHPYPDGVTASWGRQRRGVDLSGDGEGDLVVGGQRVLDARTGIEHFRWEPVPAHLHPEAYVADLDADGTHDLVLISQDGAGGLTARALRGGDFSLMWERDVSGTHPRSDRRPVFSDIDGLAGLEMETRAGWIDGRDGTVLEHVVPAGLGAIGPDRIERPHRIAGRAALIEAPEPGRPSRFVRASDLVTGEVIWEHEVRSDSGALAVDFTGDGSSDVLVSSGEPDPDVLFIDGATGTLRILDPALGTHGPYAYTFVDFDGNGVADIELFQRDAKDVLTTCYYRGTDLSLLACTERVLIGR